MQVSLQCKKGVGKRNILTFTCTCLFQQTRKSYSTNSGNSSFPQAKNLALDFTSFSFCAIFLVVFSKISPICLFSQNVEHYWRNLRLRRRQRIGNLFVVKAKINFRDKEWSKVYPTEVGGCEGPKFNSYTVGTPLVHHYSWLKGPPL